MGSWTEVKRITSRDGRRAMLILKSHDDEYRFDNLKWQKHYLPTEEDEIAPVENGHWIGPSSNHFATAAEAEAAARKRLRWLSES